MDKKPTDHHQHLKNTRDGIRIESDGLAKKTSKMRGAHLLGLASALAGGTTPTETSVSRHLATRNGITQAKHVSRATLNLPHDPNSASRLKTASNAQTAVVAWSLSNLRRINRKDKRKARMRLRRRRGRWC